MAERILLMAPDRAATLGMLDLIPGWPSASRGGCRAASSRFEHTGDPDAHWNDQQTVTDGAWM